MKSDVAHDKAQSPGKIDTRAYLTKRRAMVVFSLLIGALAIAVLIALAAGSEHISLITTLHGFWAKLIKSASTPLSIENQVIIFNLRLPRIALAIGVGAALALAGASFQSLLR
ncbi:MAG TPA: iron chelate uptake ABC transporter family permease subunit, partial [Blastocatellia bacterium]|nr:iron chelate uptake ABC transporter family permease subunit [Blastocatellia bacterium]